jgi:hypothetical protein
MRPGSWRRTDTTEAAWSLLVMSATLYASLCSSLCIAGDVPPAAAMEVHQGPHYLIESDADPLLVARISDDLDCLYAYLTAEFAGHLPQNVSTELLKVRFFKDRDRFIAYAHATCPGFNPGWFGYYRYGAAGALGEVVAYDLGSNHAVLYHEAFHQYMNRAFPGIRAWPQWFNEGLADLIGRGNPVHGAFKLGETLNNEDLGLVRTAMESSTQVPLAQLFRLDIKNWNGERMTMDYAEGYLLVSFLMRSTDPHRRDLLPSFLSALSRGQDYPSAFSSTIEAYGISILQREFNAFVRGAP